MLTLIDATKSEKRDHVVCDLSLFMPQNVHRVPRRGQLMLERTCFVTSTSTVRIIPSYSLIFFTNFFYNFQLEFKATNIARINLSFPEIFHLRKQNLNQSLSTCFWNQERYTDEKKVPTNISSSNVFYETFVERQGPSGHRNVRQIQMSQLLLQRTYMHPSSLLWYRKPIKVNSQLQPLPAISRFSSYYTGRIGWPVDKSHNWHNSRS